MKHYHFLFLLLCAFGSCINHSPKMQFPGGHAEPEVKTTVFDSSLATIHVFVALCDNKYQGIVPVPAKLGNGQDLNSNLYWGCGYGIRSYFTNSNNWKLVKKYSIDSTLMERLVFKHRQKNYYLIADAYNGKYIKQCTIDFLNSCAGKEKEVLEVNGIKLGIKGNAKLLSYIGHDGLMDFHLTESFQNADGKKRDAIILACISKSYFGQHLYSTKAYPLVWTTGLMCPEAYTLHDALESYINKKPIAETRMAAAKAYARFQHCGEKAAARLLVTGW